MAACVFIFKNWTDAWQDIVLIQSHDDVKTMSLLSTRHFLFGCDPVSTLDRPGSQIL